MNLLNPTALLWFALVVPVVGLYLLKVQPRRERVSTLFFWRELFQENKAQSLWRRLRHLVSLLLQLAFLALLVSALAEPVFDWQSRGARHVVLVIDNSASMNATDVTPTRLQRAREEALRVVAGMGFQDETAVVAAGSRARVVCGLTDHRATLRQALENVAATDGPTRVREAVELGRRLLADRPNRRILVVTDGCFDGAEELSGADDVKLLPVAGRTDNVGITRFQVRRSPLDPVAYEALAEVVNYSDGPVDCHLELGLNGTFVDVVPLHLEPGHPWSDVFRATSAEGGKLVARLDRPDALAADNEAVALLPRREPQDVLLVTAPNLYLEKVFEANPLVRLKVTRALPTAVPPGTVTVFHRQTPARLPPGPVFVIDPAGPCDLWEPGEKLSNPLVDKQDRESPLMSNARLDNLLLPEARRLTMKCQPEVLVSAATGDPLFFVVRRPGGNVLALTLNLDASDLPLRTVFPILATNAITWFAGAEAELRESYAAGTVAAVSLPTPPPEGGYWLWPPGGPPRRLTVADGKVTVGPLDAVGVWRIAAGPDVAESGGASVREIACNLANRRESDLRPSERLPADAADAAAWSENRPTWFYLIIVACLLSGLEWYLYQRRWTD
jgi:hypothetical protein